LKKTGREAHAVSGKLLGPYPRKLAGRLFIVAIARIPSARKNGGKFAFRSIVQPRPNNV
jgi:hypothetical protein